MTLIDDGVLARKALEAPRIPWHIFIADKFQWRQGEHVAIIGPTGQGKTTLLINMLPLHPYVVVFASKPHDPVMDALVKRGYHKLGKWEHLSVDKYPRRVLWPDASGLGSSGKQAEVFHQAFEKIYRERGWTVVIDELWYIINTLKLDHDVKMYLLQARSLGISLVSATQRPAWVPLEIYDQSTHLFFFKDSDERNLSRLSGISYRSAYLIRELISGLDSHQVLYVNTRTGEMFRTRCPDVTMESDSK